MKTKIFAAALSAALPLLAACATTGMSDSEKLALYSSHAGKPVSSFHYFGRIDGWTPLGDSAVAVWTKPNQAYLLSLYGPCQNLEFTPVIGVTSQMNQVYAKFDKIIAHDRGSIEMPCRINEIRPLDVKAIKAAEKTARDQASPSTGT